MDATNGVGSSHGPAVDIVGTLLVLGGLYLLSLNVHARILQIPGYLLVLFASLVGNALFPGLGGTAWQVFFGAFVIVLAAVIGVVTHRVRTKR